MATDRFRETLEALEIMKDLEKLVAEFYELCARSFGHSHAFWMELAREETQHSAAISALADHMTKKPDQFSPGEPFALPALRTFHSKVRSDIQKLHQGALTEKDSLFIAYHIENTVIEAKYTEIVATTDKYYSEILARLTAAEIDHRDRVVKRMKESKYGYI